METKRRTIGTIILQIALGLLFLVSGIWSLQTGKGDEIAKAIRSLFNVDTAKIICIVFAIIEIVAGVFLLLRLFVPIGTNLDNVLMLIIMICWIACIIITDFMGSSGLFNNFDNVLNVLNQLSRHLVILGAIITVRK